MMTGLAEQMENPSLEMGRPIRIKVMSRENYPDGSSRLERQLLPGWAEARGLDFIFDPDARDYDWLVVYENLPASGSERRPMRIEQLACARANTILFTTEPSGVKIYARAFVRQFGHIVTSQEAFALRHPGRILSQAGLRWYYGDNGRNGMTAAEIAAHEPQKTALISTVCSTKRQTHTLHKLRYDFTELLARHLPGLEVFGRGRPREVVDKAEAIDDFRYHIAIENHIAPHHITEKLPDALLGLSLPFYFGAPNTTDYFPADSFIPIDIRKPEEAMAVIRKAIDDNEYEKRLPAIREARRRVLEEHSLFPLIHRVVTENRTGARAVPGEVIYSQRAAKKAHPISAAADFLLRLALHAGNRVRNGLTGT